MRYLFFFGGLATMLAAPALPFFTSFPWLAPPLALLGATSALLARRAMKRQNKIAARKALTKLPGDKERVLPERKILPKKKSKLE